MFKKFYLIALSFFCLSAHAEFLDNKEIEITYSEKNVSKLFSESEIKNAIEKGLNYWGDCFNKNIYLTNKESNFNIIWGNDLDNKEFGIANYSMIEKKVISFSI